MENEKFWVVKVEVRHENEKGKLQKTQESYLVEAYTPTDAEATVVAHFEGESNYTVKSINSSKILEVLTNEKGDSND